ncbi:MAG: PLP-dependent aminotransferase family protein [Coriobacteriales bacterium]|nr:PLP-dependent aminotransferase family protein [Coriobacteriales bacterium]
MANKKRPDLLLTVDPQLPQPLYQQIYQQLRDAIISGRMREGDHLGSIRRLSKDLHVSHTTVEQAYTQLVVEGLVHNVPRSGHVVAKVDTEYLALARSADLETVRQLEALRDKRGFFAENRAGGQARYDFSYANLQPDSFPVETWRKLADQVLYARTAPQLARYSYTDETCSLQVELAQLLARTRAVTCAPEQVTIQSGTGESLAMILQLFDRERDATCMEEPGYATVQEVAHRQGFSLLPIPVDLGAERFHAALREQHPRIVFTTPSHQFPTGNVLLMEDRIKLLKWAQENDAYIIEDDSCNEYRYNSDPIPSLQSLDAFGRVIYLCNISKVLSPSLRISYTVLPSALLERYWKRFNYAHPSVSWLDQEILARFIAQGLWDAHVRKTASGNRRRQDLLLHCLEQELGDIIQVSGANSGMHLYVTVTNGMSEHELLESALEQGAMDYGSSRLRFSGRETSAPSVLVGFSAIDIDDIEEGVHALRRAWR